MTLNFNPTAIRKYWFDRGLKYRAELVPEKQTPMGRSISMAMDLNAFVQAYYVGLADAIRPTLEQRIRWMEAQAENEPRQHSREFGHWRAGWYDLYSWRRSLGVCKWLSRGDSAQHDFSRALSAEWYGWTEASPSDSAVDYSELLETLTEYLAMAIAAREPALGLKFLARVDLEEYLKGADEVEIPLLRFGEWACRHLAAGGKQDAGFAAEGAAMLRGGFPDFFLDGRRTEAALWLKAIFWDTGMVATPEQALTKIYDFLPGIERPSFVSP